MCTWSTAYNGNASFTWYYFGQGTARSGSGYKTACGYYGTESGTGQSAVDTVTHIASASPANSTYFAAIPGSGQFSTVTDCGACVEITGMNGTKIVATIIDECPISSNSACASTGHLDLSTQAFNQLGYSVGNPSGTTWKFVPCPVTGNIVAVVNSANQQYYFQNSVYPITAVNGQGPTPYGYFNVMPGSVTITSSASNQTIQGTLQSGGGDVGVQFTPGSGCY